MQPIRFTAAYRVAHAPTWLQQLADQAEELIRSANRGEYPVTWPQLRAVAATYRLLLCTDGRAPLPGLLVDDVIIVSDRGGKLATWPRIVHEIVEHLARSERMPDAAARRDARVPHFVAEIVEHRYAVFLAGVERAREEMRRVTRAARRMMPYDETPDIFRVKDLWCDADFQTD